MAATSMKSLPRHFENSEKISAPAAAVFAHLDDQRRLSAHMSQSSWMMVGSRMDFEFDASEGRAVGSRSLCVAASLVYLSRSTKSLRRIPPDLENLGDNRNSQPVRHRSLPDGF